MKRLRSNRFSRPQLAIFVLIFAAIGGIIIWRSLAAPNPDLPGDLNSDNTVNVTDLSILLSNYGTTNAAADINGDGVVNVLDLSVLLSHYGQSYTPPASFGRFGYAMHINRMSDQSTYVNEALNGGAKTIRDDFAWSSIETSLNTYNWNGPDNIIKQTAPKGLDVLAMAGYSPSWASSCGGGDKCGPTNVSYYADFVKQVALRYGHNGSFWTDNPTIPKHPIAIEIWNEPNISFWANPNPANYTALLKAGYTAIKSVDPQMTVVSAGLAPYGSYGSVASDGSRINPVTFLEGMYKAGVAGYMDAVGWHPYNYQSGWTATYMLSNQVWSAWSQMSQTSPSARSLMTQYGDGNKKIWATELGAPTNLVGETEQGNLATQEVSSWKSYSWAGNYYWYDLRDDCTTSTDNECHFGAVRTDNSLKPAYTALKNAWQ